MNTMKYALAMLGVAMAPVAHAAVIEGSFVNTFSGLDETFDIETTPVFTSGQIASFTLTNDSLGATSFNVFEVLVGPGLEFVNTSNGPTTIGKDLFTPPPWDPATGLVKGYYADSFGGSVLTLGVPEPGTWALLIAGVGMAGGALRRDRRRRQSALAIA